MSKVIKMVRRSDFEGLDYSEVGLKLLQILTDFFPRDKEISVNFMRCLPNIISSLIIYYSHEENKLSDELTDAMFFSIKDLIKSYFDVVH